MPRNGITRDVVQPHREEAELVARYGIMVPDARLPSGWHISLGTFWWSPCPPSARLPWREPSASFDRVDVGDEGGSGLHEKQPSLAAVLAQDNAARIQQFDDPYKRSRNNTDGRYDFCDGRSFQDVIAAYRVQVSEGSASRSAPLREATPAPIER